MKTVSKPNVALNRLDKLVGNWNLVGRTLDSKEDNIKGHVKIEWILDGFYLQQTGVIEMKDTKMESIEIIGYDPSAGNFPAFVYGKMNSTPLAYFWDLHGNKVTHWTKGSIYTGHLSEDGKTLTGGWRPDGTEQEAAFAYDATMTKRK